jgi:EmrB/QacA subfamily drug resistance transporter
MNNNKLFTFNRKEILVLFSICLAAIMCPLDSYIINIALPSISKSFAISVTQSSLIAVVYLLMLTSTLITFGKLADQIGYKKVFVTGFVFFTTGSLLSGLAHSLDFLLFSRAIQGLGSSMLIAVSFALIANNIPREKAGRAYAIISTCAGLGIALGAPLGGIITSYLSWQWVFFINIPVGILAIYFSSNYLPSDLVSRENLKKALWQFDFIGAALLIFCIALLIISIERGSVLTTYPMVFVGIIVTFCLTLVYFIHREITITNPLVDFRIFKNINFDLANVSNIFAYILFAGTNFLLPFYLIYAKGFNAKTAGFIILSFSLAYMLCCPVVGILSDKIKPKYLCISGMTLAGLSSFLFAMTLQKPGILAVIVYLILLAVSYSMFNAPINCLVMDFTPAELYGSAASIFKTQNYLSFSLGVSIFSALFSFFIYTGSGVHYAGDMISKIPVANLMIVFHNIFLTGLVISPNQ